MVKITGYGILSYIFICFCFWAVCKCFGSNRTVSDHIKAWGISYAPTAICAIVVALTEVFFYIFWNNTIWGMFLNIVFVGILIWKAILYFVYLKDFANLKGWRFFTACVVMKSLKDFNSKKEAEVFYKQEALNAMNKYLDFNGKEALKHIKPNVTIETKAYYDQAEKQEKEYLKKDLADKTITIGAFKKVFPVKK